MRTLVLTSNGYHNLLVPFAHYWQRFAGSSHPVTVACYEAEVPELPHNFEVMRIGNQADHTWSSGLATALDALTLRADQQVMLLLEDYFLTETVDWAKVNFAKRQIVEDDRIGKVDLSDDRSKLAFHPIMPEAGMSVIESEPTARFQTSLQAAIWDITLLQDLLNASEDAWQFERLGTDRWIGLRADEFSAYGQGYRSRLLAFQSPPLKYANACGGMGQKPGVIEAKHMPSWMFEDCVARGWAHG